MRTGTRLLLAALLGLTACGAAEPTRFYLLSPQPQVAAERVAGPVVFVDQATIAPYLDRAQIVSRVAPDQVAFADTRTWAEPVTSMITRYVADELGARFGSDRVLETPARRDLPPDFRLAIDVQRFDGDQAGTMVLDARWTLLAGPDERFAATGRERFAEPAEDPASWDSRVAALGRAPSRSSLDPSESTTSASATPIHTTCHAASAQATPSAAVTQTVAAVVRLRTASCWRWRKMTPAPMKPTPVMTPWRMPCRTRLIASALPAMPG